MKKHTEIFFKYYGYTKADIVLCQYCGRVAVDIHHIEPKGMGGSKEKDRIDNLIALCRKCHEDAHAGIISKDELKNAIKPYLKWTPGH